MSQIQKTCAVCDKNIHGRKDKIYCGSDCKNEYHNTKRKFRAKAHSYYSKRTFNNYEIIQSILKERTEIKLPYAMLQSEGFDEQYATSWQVNGTIRDISIYSIKCRFDDSKDYVHIQKLPDQLNIDKLINKRWRYKYRLFLDNPAPVSIPRIENFRPPARIF